MALRKNDRRCAPENPVLLPQPTLVISKPDTSPAGYALAGGVSHPMDDAV